MSSLSIEQKTDGKTLLLRLAGQIDEDADYGAVKTAGAARVVFDFEKVNLINSTGLQRWIKFLSAIDPKIEVAFTRCSIRVVTQINMFPGFLAGRPVKVESFFAPYFCQSCDSSCDILLETTQFPDRTSPKAPKASCPRCSGAAEFDAIEKKFFLFLKP